MYILRFKVGSSDALNGARCRGTARGWRYGLFHPGPWTALLREEPGMYPMAQICLERKRPHTGTAGHQHPQEQMGRREEGLASGSLLTGFLLPGSSHNRFQGEGTREQEVERRPLLETARHAERLKFGARVREHVR